MNVALGDAMDRYRARFRSYPPMTLKLPSDCLPALVRAMDGAVARGRALTDREVVGLAGMTMPDGWDGPLPPGVWPPLL